MARIHSSSHGLLDGPRAKKPRPSVEALSMEVSHKVLAEPVHAALVKAGQALPDECAVLSTLFKGLEIVLCILDSRKSKTLLPIVKADVESFTKRELSDTRFAQVLAIAGPDMLDVQWPSSGREAKLEVFRRAKDGSRYGTMMEEAQERQAKFDAALAAVAGFEIPQRAFPERPGSGSFTTFSQNQEARGIPTLPEPVVVKAASSEGLSAIQRKAAILQRVRARKAAGESVEAKEYQALHRRIEVCDNALTVHSVLSSLFARSQGKHSGATEDELMSAVCSSTYGMQCRRTLKKVDAQEAVDLLATKSAEWFFVVDAVKNFGVKIFRQLPKGKVAAALAALTAEREDLERQLRALCELTTQKQQQMNSDHRQHSTSWEVAALASQATSSDQRMGASNSKAENSEGACQLHRRLRRKTTVRN